MKNNKFVLQQAQTQNNGWVCADVENGIVCSFDDGKFNETQKITILNDIAKPDAQKIAGIVREMGDWLRENHYDKIFYNIREKFGENLKKIRNEKDLTVRGLADLSGLSKSTIENIEQARYSCSLDVIYKIARGLNIPIRDLIDF
jgi:DNA-binding XRE family transcriptional regulator